jgi:hypothetical protein
MTTGPKGRTSPVPDAGAPPTIHKQEIHAYR